MIIKKIIGKTAYTFVFEGANLYETITESQKLSFPDVTECGLCGSDDMYLSAHLAQGKYKYHEIRCNHCKAELSFGTREDNPDCSYLQRKENGELNWKKFSANQQEPPAQKNTAPPANNKPAHKPAPQPEKAAQQKPANNRVNKGKANISKNALILASNIAIAANEEHLSGFANTIANNKHLTPDDIDYLRSEYSRRLNILRSAPMQQMVN